MTKRGSLQMHKKHTLNTHFRKYILSDLFFTLALCLTICEVHLFHLDLTILPSDLFLEMLR